MSRNLQCVFIFILVVSLERAQELELGDKCIFEYTGEEGICKIATDCPRVQEEARRGIKPTRCGFYGFSTPILCCYDNVFLSSQNSNNGPAVPNENIFFPSHNNGPPIPNENTFLPGENSHIIFPDEGIPSREQFPSQSISKSEQKCSQYSKAVTTVVQALPLVTDTEPINISVEKCPYNSVPLIVGGSPASAAEFPFMAALGFYVDGSLEWLCGATLVSEQYVLTAAHCTVTRNSNGPEIIRLGDLNLARTDESEHKDYQVGDIVVHPDYKYPQKYNDIALIKSRETVTFTKYIRPACLYNRNIKQNSTGIATGWGKTDWAASENSNLLLKVTLKIYDNSQCDRTYGKSKHIPKGIDGSMICAGELKGGKDTCQGDSGGPLLITKDGNQCKFYIIGVTSFGKSCGQRQTPAVYTKVSKYIPWIEQTIW